MTQRRKPTPITQTHADAEPLVAEIEKVETKATEVEVEETTKSEPIPVPEEKPKPREPYVRPTAPLPPKEVSRHPRNIPRYGK